MCVTAEITSHLKKNPKMVTKVLLTHTVHPHIAHSTEAIGINLELCNWKVIFTSKPGDNFFKRGEGVSVTEAT